MSSLRKFFIYVLAPLLLLISIGIGVHLERSGLITVVQAKVPSTVLNFRIFGLDTSASVNEVVSTDVNFQLFWEVWRTLKTLYYKQPLDDQQLFYGALRGLASGVGDPYTVFLEPVAAQEFDQSIMGAFGGIGAEIGLRNEAIQIVAPLDGTPAHKAGLLAGDMIIKVDNQDTSGWSVEKAVRTIRGPKGTKVTLTIFRAGAKKPIFDVTITRAEIHIQSVKAKILPGNLLYIQMSAFNADAYERLNTVLADYLPKKPKGLILDLRNNPGGLLDQAQRVAGLWIGEQTVLGQRGKHGVIVDLPAVGRPRLDKLKTLVLVNQGSASASEIVAGALQDYGFAKLLGTKTFGKGSVQELHQLSGGATLKVTIAEWLTPKHRVINGAGLIPDMIIEQTQEDYDAKRDPVLDAAERLLRGDPPKSTTPPARRLSPSVPRTP